jgi:hypothetical protein
MKDLTNYLSGYSDDLNRTGQEAIKAGLALIKLLLKEQPKSPTVTRTNPHSAEAESSMYKIIKKSSNLPIFSPEEATNKSLATLNSLLANTKELKAEEINVGTDRYKISKYRGGGIAIESDNSKIFAKGGRIDFSGEEQTQIVNDLPEIVTELESRLPRKQQLDNYEVLYGFDKNNKFIEQPLSKEDATAILALLAGKEGTIIENGEHLLIEHDGQKLFETDERGTVIYSAYDRNPELLSNIREQDKKGLKQLTDYAERMVNQSHATGVEVKKADTNTDAIAIESLAQPMVDEAAKNTTTIPPDRPTARALNNREPTERTTSQLVNILNERILDSAYQDPAVNQRVEVEGIKFDRKPRPKVGGYSLYITPPDERQSIRLGAVDKDGKFAAVPGLKDRQDIQELVKAILTVREVDFQPVKDHNLNQKFIPLTRANVEQAHKSASLKQDNSRWLQSSTNSSDIDRNYDPSKIGFGESEQPQSQQSNRTANIPISQLNSSQKLPQQPNQGTVTIPTSKLNGGDREPSQQPPQAQNHRTIGRG